MNLSSPSMIETSRLLLRPLGLPDAPFIRRLFPRPDVLEPFFDSYRNSCFQL